MNITKNALVVITYELHTDAQDGPFVESCDVSRPLKFVFGAGRMLPAFEAALESLAAGDSFAFSLSPEDAYGERSNDAIVEVPKNIFVTPDGRLREEYLQLGARVPLLNDMGQKIVGTVLSVSDSVVTLDFNPPLAGETLFFSGKVLEVREATADELLNQHHGCGGGCNGGCGGGCHGHDDEEGCCGGGCHGHDDEEGCCGGGCHGHDDEEGCCGGGCHDSDEGGCGSCGCH